jgi:hypothetical protein
MHVPLWTFQSLSSASQPVVRAPKGGELTGDRRIDLEIILFFHNSTIVVLTILLKSLEMYLSGQKNIQK